MALVLCLLHAPTHAIEILRRNQRDDGPQQQLIISIRTLEALLTLGALQDAESLTEKLINCATDELGDNLLPSEVDIYCHLALLFEKMGHLEPSKLLASRSAACFASLDDELGLFRAAQIACRCASGAAEEAHWAALVEKLAMKSSYCRILSEVSCKSGVRRQIGDIRNVERLNLTLLGHS